MSRRALFRTFEAARDFGGRVGRGYPAWLVVEVSGGWWGVRCRPGGDFFDVDGVVTKDQREQRR